MMIHPTYGSYLFLGEILTDLPLEVGQGEIPDGCGGCTLCLKECPTAAFVAPRVLDAGRCISTWTVEVRGELPPSAPRLHGHLFGCDRCQEVCPYNREAPLSAEPDFQPRPEWFAPAPAAVLALTGPELEARLSGSGLRRAGEAGLRRSALRILEEEISEA